MHRRSEESLSNRFVEVGNAASHKRVLKPSKPTSPWRWGELPRPSFVIPCGVSTNASEVQVLSNNVLSLTSRHVRYEFTRGPPPDHHRKQPEPSYPRTGHPSSHPGFRRLRINPHDTAFQAVNTTVAGNPSSTSIRSTLHHLHRLLPLGRALLPLPLHLLPVSSVVRDTARLQSFLPFWEQ